MRCRRCDAKLELTMSACPACGAEVELGRLTGILGIVCRGCDAYNEPGARTCAGCGKPLGDAPAPEPAAPSPPVAPPPPPAAGAPVVRAYQKVGAAGGPATRVVPAILRPSRPKPPPERPLVTPVPLAGACPACGADAGAGRFCPRCGQALGARGTQVVMKPFPPARPAGSGGLAPGRVALVLVSAEGAGGATWRLEADTVAAGRSTGAVTFPGDSCLAPHHATFLFRSGALHVRDEGAPGGVLLRLRGPSVPLRPGDHFAVGERLLRYAGPLPPAPAPPPDGTRRLGSPRPAQAVVVEERLEGGAVGRVFVRSGPSVTIGRAGCALSLGDDPGLSPSHAELVVDAAGAARLRDLGSPSGTYLRLPPRAERELRDGDCVRIGREVLRVAVV